MINFFKMGYTLLELLLVISITAIISLIGFASYRSFNSDQVISKAVGDLQNMLRLAQTNASSSVFCTDGINTGSWKAIINQTSLTLNCGPSSSVEKTYTLDKAQITSVKGSSAACGANALPLTITYVAIAGNLVFESASSSPSCLDSASWLFTIATQDASKTKTFNLSKGGAVDAQ